MAEEKVLIVVCKDLSCRRCSKKMNRILEKYKDEWCIKKVEWDIKCNKITLSGPFNPHDLEKKLCCKACRIIIDFEIPPCPKKEKPPPPAPPPPPSPPPPQLVYVKGQICICGKPEPPKPEPPKPEPPKPEPPPPPPPTVNCQICICGKLGPCKPEPCKPEPCKPEPPPPPPTPPKVNCQICVCAMCHEKKENGCHSGGSCQDGHDEYWCNYPPPPCYGRPPTCQMVYEDAPNGCTIM